MFSSEQWLANSGGDFYNGVATTSVRLAGDSYLTLDNAGSATGTQKCTLSCWFKRTELTVLSYLFHSKNDSGGASFAITFDAADTISVTQHSGSAYDFGVTVAPRKFRDMSAWYHLVVAIDTTLGSGTTNEADRIKIYINGTRQTVVATNEGSGLQDFADEDQTVASFQDGEQRWGATVDDSHMAHIYLAECNGVDGLALDASYFGETKNGVWIPIAPNVSEYGNHGFRLQFTSTAHDAPASLGSADTDNIGADSSGKNNHFTAVDAIGTHDCALPDSPENNFAITSQDFKRAFRASTSAVSEGNLKHAQSSGDGCLILSSMRINEVLSNGSGVYWEVRVNGGTSNNSYAGILAGQLNNNLSSATGPNTWPIKVVKDYLRGYFYINGTGSIDYTSTTYGVNDIIGFAIDSSGGFYMHKNGTYHNNVNGSAQNPSTGANALSTLDLANDWFPFSDGASAVHYNFGQDSTFAGAISAGGEADANGIGDFAYAVPTGFLALCTANMAEPTIGPNSSSQATDYFETILYSSSSGSAAAGSATAQDIAGLDFKPDFVWIKSRSYDYHHALFDSARLAGRIIYSSDNFVEGNYSDSLDEFRDDGFGLGADSTGQVNFQNNTYVAWNWKANGGTATATISESGDNPAAVVQANATAGFSLITYTGTGDAGTIAHGLGAVPTMMMIKNRDVTDSWAVYHGANTAAPATDYLILDTNAATDDSDTMWADAAPTDSVFTVHDSHQVNADGEKYVAYVFADVEGYSKMGGYFGNNAADGTFVYLGFRPAWIMFKRSNATEHWHILDIKRDSFNFMDNEVWASLPNGESSGTERADFLSNGFKIGGNNAGYNTSHNYIYMAFAEAPFKYANAR